MSQNKIYCKDCKYWTEWCDMYTEPHCTYQEKYKNMITGITHYKWIYSGNQYKKMNFGNDCKYFKESIWFKIKKFFNKFK